MYITKIFTIIKIRYICLYSIIWDLYRFHSALSDEGEAPSAVVLAQGSLWAEVCVQKTWTTIHQAWKCWRCRADLSREERCMGPHLAGPGKSWRTWPLCRMPLIVSGVPTDTTRGCGFCPEAYEPIWLLQRVKGQFTPFLKAHHQGHNWPQRVSG